MKKIDLHIHTVPTIWDAHFELDLDTLKDYVNQASLDAIAITNHNKFDRTQFELIKDSLDVIVFPGIEVSLSCGHLLVIADANDLDEFEKRAETIESRLTGESDKISVEDFSVAFAPLDDHLLIPHHGKRPAVSDTALAHLGDEVFCGEVTSPKKFEAVKKAGKLSPVLFSDCRADRSLNPLQAKQTYVDCGDLSLPSLKTALRDKEKVALSPTHGLFEVFSNGQLLSTGLNVLLGERSSGKTHLLDQINESQENPHYIKQFELVERDETESSRNFANDLGRNESRVAERFLDDLSQVVAEVMDIDVDANDSRVDKYVRSVHESAAESHRQDVFSKTALYRSQPFSISNSNDLKKLIEATQELINNSKYKFLIDAHVESKVLKRLAMELIEQFRQEDLVRRKRELVNKTVLEIQRQLRMVTSAPPIERIDLFEIMLDREKVKHFNALVELARRPGVIHEDPFQKYRVVASKGPFKGAGEVKAKSGTNAAFSDAFTKYDVPYEYLRALLGIGTVPKADIYKLLVKVSYEILNQHDLKVSGGERSEFNLLQRIKDAQKYEMLLIDEPESSFDNLFLQSNVNRLIKDLARTMPVVIVTHNSTIGASIEPNYLVYTQKIIQDGKPVFKVFSGYPTDLTLSTVDGECISTHELTLNSLEAGEDAYQRRNTRYEAIKS
ncbi:MAG: phosphotransferase [Planctomycetota bacterium]